MCSSHAIIMHNLILDNCFISLHHYEWRFIWHHSGYLPWPDLDAAMIHIT